jgi:hypothetical protein
MTSELTALLKSGWDNLWKRNIIWLFSSLILIEPLLRFLLPIQRYKDLLPSFLNLVISWASFYFTILSITGTAYVVYYIVAEKTVDFITAFQESQKLFWRIVSLTFLVALFVIPLACIIAYILWRLLLIRDVRHDLFFASIPISAFAAMSYFPITEMIANKSTISKSLKSAWIIFTDNLFNLAIIGILLIIGFRLITLLIAMTMFLFQSNFDLSVISNFDLINPQFPFPQNAIYRLLAAIPQAVWQTYSISIFTVAYLKYSSAKMSNDIIT